MRTATPASHRSTAICSSTVVVKMEGRIVREKTDQAAFRAERAARLMREALEEDTLFDKGLGQWIRGSGVDNATRAAPQHHADTLADLGGNEVVSPILSTVGRTAPTGEPNRALLRVLSTMISEGR